MKFIEWNEIEGMLELIANMVNKQGIDTLVGISRSGLIPTVMLSHWLNIRNVSILDIARTQSDDLNASKSPPILRGILNERLLQNANILIVDDILGEGYTMGLACSLLENIASQLQTAVLVVNQANLGDRKPNTVVDYFGCIVHDWVVFPWEGKQFDY